MAARRSGVRDLEAVAYVTANYSHLQGLRIVPFGVLFLAVAAREAGLLPWPATDGGDVGRWFLIGVATAAAVGATVGRYYRARYGSVQPRAINRASLVLGLVALAVGVLLWRQLVAEWAVPVPVVFIGGALVWLGSARSAVRRHYVIIGCAWLLFPAVGSVGLSGEARRLLFDILIGASLIGAGIGDHLLLRELLVPPTETHGRAV